MPNILIIDDEKAICSSLSFVLEDEHNVWTATDAEEGLSLLNDEPIDCVLLDLNLGHQNGLEYIPRIKEKKPETIVIIMTAYGTIESSIAAIKAGAYHYLTKPLNIEEVKLLLHKAFDLQYLHQQIKALSAAVKQQHSYAGMIGKSEPIQKVFQLIDKVKDIASNVLVTGESGTGKELVARAIHYQGIRKNEPFSVINCAAIPEQLLESELFGHEKGAFTGAFQRKEGLFERSKNGTVFLDEIGEMPLSLQAKILRIIQERTVRPLGSFQLIETDVRIIAATNRNLQEEVAKGNFREDLYYRLNVIPIHMPSLGERKEDVPLLIEHFLAFYSASMGKKKKSTSSEVKRLLYDYPYPGNIRELANIIEYAVALSQDDRIELDDLPASVFSNNRLAETNGSRSMEKGVFIPASLSLAEAEKKIILYTLDRNGGHRIKTAQQLGISERGLRDKLKQYLKEE